MLAERSMPSESTPQRDPLRALRRATLLLIAIGSCEAGPSVGLDFSKHDRCTGASPQDVDASASEIQCRTTYIFSTTVDEAMPISEEGMNVLGEPTCCEVCTLSDTADDACKATCKYELCSRAKDAHIMVGQQLSGLSGCGLVDCGFDFDTCMTTNALHVQSINTGEGLPEFYGLQASCFAHADDSTRADGLFAYLEDLDGIPGASGSLADVEDVVAYCLDLHASGATGPAEDPTAGGGSTPPLDDGADSTGGLGGSTDTSGEAPSPGRGTTPAPCGPYARERFWVRPSNNFGTWNVVDGSLIGIDAATHEARVIDGGISYTVFPCTGAPRADCIRLDRLSVHLTEVDSGLVIRLSLLDDPGLMPVTDQGHFDVPAGALRLAIRYEQEDRQRVVIARSSERARGHIDTRTRTLRLEALDATSEHGDALAIPSLEASLSNTQPRTEIIESRDARDGSSVLVARSSDADGDPIVHRWMIPGVGTWRGDTIAPSLPPGRYAVILYADDVHRARGIAAQWLEVSPKTP